MHFKDNQTRNLRVVDPIADEGVWAIMDDGCNRCCHGELLATKRLSEDESFGPSLHLAAQNGTYFQWCWNEHDKWNVKYSHGHAAAGVRHGDTEVRAFI